MHDDYEELILDALHDSVEHDLQYADCDYGVLADEFPELDADDLAPTLYLEDEFREKPFPVWWLDTTSCDGRWGGVHGAPDYDIVTMDDGHNTTIYLDYMGFRKPLWTGGKADDTSWAEIYGSACRVLEERELP